MMIHAQERLPQARVRRAGTLAHPVAALSRARRGIRRARPAARTVAAYCAGLFPLVVVVIAAGFMVWVIGMSASP